MVSASSHEHQHIIDLIDEASSFVILASPFVRRDRVLQRAIARAVARGVYVKVICRPGQDACLERVADWCDVTTVERFHAKVYANEATALAGSLNLRSPGRTASVEASQTVHRCDDETAYLDLLEAIQQIRDQGTREAEPADEARLQTVADMILRPRPSSYCVHCGQGLRSAGDDDSPSWMCGRCEAHAFANNVAAYSHTSFCHQCGCASERPWSQFLCPDCYRHCRAARPARWRVEFSHGRLSAQLPASWSETAARSPRIAGHPIKGVRRAVAARVHRLAGERCVRSTLRTAEGGISLAASLISVLPGDSDLWSGVRHLVVERSKRPPNPLPSGSTESRIQLDVCAEEDVRGPDHWVGSEPLAEWDVTLAAAPDGLSGPKLTAVAARPRAPHLLEERTPLGLEIVVAGPAGSDFNLVRWTLGSLVWFVAAAHQIDPGPPPNKEAAPLWAKVTERISKPGALGPARIETDGRTLEVRGARVGELGLIRAERQEHELEHWKVTARLTRLQARSLH